MLTVNASETLHHYQLGKVKSHRKPHVEFLLEQIKHLENILRHHQSNESLDKSITEAVSNIELLAAAHSTQQLTLKLEDKTFELCGLNDGLTGRSRLARLLQGVVLENSSKAEFENAKREMNLLIEHYKKTYFNITESPIGTLPPVILMLILTHIEPRKRAALTRVSKHWRAVISNHFNLPIEILHEFDVHPTIINHCTNKLELYKRLWLSRTIDIFSSISKARKDYVQLFTDQNSYYTTKFYSDPMKLSWLLNPHDSNLNETLVLYLSTLDHEELKKSLVYAASVGNDEFVKFVFSQKCSQLKTLSTDDTMIAIRSGIDALVNRLSRIPYTAPNTRPHINSNPDHRRSYQLWGALFRHSASSSQKVHTLPHRIIDNILSANNNVDLLHQVCENVDFTQLNDAKLKRLQSTLMYYSFTASYIYLDKSYELFNYTDNAIANRFTLSLKNHAWGIANYLLKFYPVEINALHIELAQKNGGVEFIPAIKTLLSEKEIDDEVKSFTLL